MKTLNSSTYYNQNNTIEAEESDYLYIEKSQIKNAGNGLFTAIDIYENEVISLFKGEIISDEEAANRVQLKEDQYYINMLDGTIMDSRLTHCFAKYANDAEGIIYGCFKNNAQITLDDDDNVCITAINAISSGEEIFCSYGKSYWDKHR